MSTEGSAKPAMKTKITNASSRFMATPASRMIVRTLRGLALKLRGSSAWSPSSPSSRTKPPIGSQFRV